ncbi:sulfotransferase family protein [Fundidesulfovibrio agrisoli]|uniref:sulfotransferase family protein n=1 Tax=Fundidesulfovibrio agrisoli TaxID=2922717 RepID=UPI001FAD69B0|nr:hypothetical protein [Fundidesulfovibrio agrisoli]
MMKTDMNPRGFFENTDIVSIHDMLLQELGCRWDNIGNYPLRWLETDAAKVAQGRIRRIIERDFADKEFFVIKDPRMCRLFPLWSDILETKHIKPKVVLIVRHPFEVAKSLQKHHGFSMLKGHLLWLNHIRDSIFHSASFHREFIRYDDLLAEPLRCLNKIIGGLNLAPLVSQKFAYEAVVDIVKPDLKHFKRDSGAAVEFSHYSVIYDDIIQKFSCQTEDILPCSVKIFEEHRSAGVPSSSLSNIFDLSIEFRQTVEAVPAGALLDDYLSIVNQFEQLEFQKLVQQRNFVTQADQQSEPIFSQVFFPDIPPNIYHDGFSQKFIMLNEEWQTLDFTLPHPGRCRVVPLRFDPLNTVGFVVIASIKVVDGANGNCLWEMPKDRLFEDVQLIKDCFAISCDNGLHLCCTGNDPEIHFPTLPVFADKPLRMEVQIKACRNIRSLQSYWEDLQSSFARASGSALSVTGLESALIERDQRIANLEGALEQSRAREEISSLNEEDATRKLRDIESVLVDKVKLIETLEASLDLSRAREVTFLQDLEDTSRADFQKQIATLQSQYQEARDQFDKCSQEIVCLTNMLIENEKVAEEHDKERSKFSEQLDELARLQLEHDQAQQNFGKLIGRLISELLNYAGTTRLSPEFYRELAAKLIQCGLFDSEWYLDRYEDVRQEQMNPLEHYILYGMFEGRSPRSLFKC